MAVRIGGEREVLFSPQFDVALRLCAKKGLEELLLEEKRLAAGHKKASRHSMWAMLLFFLLMFTTVPALAVYAASRHMKELPLVEGTVLLAVTCLPALYWSMRSQDRERALKRELATTREAARIHRKGSVMIQVITRAIGGVVAENRP